MKHHHLRPKLHLIWPLQSSIVLLSSEENHHQQQQQQWTECQYAMEKNCLHDLNMIMHCRALLKIVQANKVWTELFFYFKHHCFHFFGVGRHTVHHMPICATLGVPWQLEVNSSFRFIWPISLLHTDPPIDFIKFLVLIIGSGTHTIVETVFCVFILDYFAFKRRRADSTYFISSYWLDELRIFMISFWNMPVVKAVQLVPYLYAMDFTSAAGSERRKNCKLADFVHSRASRKCLR